MVQGDDWGICFMLSVKLIDYYYLTFYVQNLKNLNISYEKSYVSSFSQVFFNKTGVFHHLLSLVFHLSLTNLLCRNVGLSCNVLQLLLSDSWWLASLIYFSMSIITTAPPSSVLVSIISFLFANSTIAFCSHLDRLGYEFFIFFFFSLLRSFFTLWWVIQMSTFVCFLFGRVGFLNLCSTLGRYP